MRCVFVAYEEAFQRASTAIERADAGALRTVCGAAEDLPVDESMAALLALSDAKRGRPRRERTAVCEALSGFCCCDAPRREQTARVIPIARVKPVRVAR